MKKLILLFFSFFLVSNVSSQDKSPVHWTAVYKSISATEGEIFITASIDKGFHIYSQRPTDAGPISTSFSFAPGQDYSLIGTTEEGNVHETFEKALDATVYAFSETAEFKQKIRLNKKGSSIKFKVESVCCNEMTCFPPKVVELSVKAD